MTEAAQPIISITTPNRSFEGHENTVSAVAVFPDGHRMVMSSHDQKLRLYDLERGVVLKEMEGHGSRVVAVAVSGNGRFIASGDDNGKLITWHGNTGESLVHAMDAHTGRVQSLDFSPDGTVLATGSNDKMVKLWSTKTWQLHGHPISSTGKVSCVRYSPSGELLAIATHKNIKIWNPHTGEYIAKLNVIKSLSLAWTPDGTRLLSAYTSIQEWDTSRWQQVGNSWNGHTKFIYAIALNSTGTLVASASRDNNVCLWQRSDQRTIAIFMHSEPVVCVAFSMHDNHIFSGGYDKKILEWTVPEDTLLQDPPKEQAPEDTLPENPSEEHVISKILPMNSTVRNACIIGHLARAEKLLTHDISIDRNNHKSYANRSLLMSRKGQWDNALGDALTSIKIQPSLAGYLSQGIALCGKKLLWDAMRVFDLAFMFTDEDPKTILLLLLVKAIALFNANQHQDAMLRIREVASAHPNVDIRACRVIEACLHVQLGINALDKASHNEAADHFAAAINSSAFSAEHAFHLKYEVFLVLFGWDPMSLWQTANQKRCHALLRAGRLAEAHEAYRSMTDMSDEPTTVCCHDCSVAFEQECPALYVSQGDAALSTKDYDKAIKFYSAAIDLHSASDTIFANRCTAKLGKMLWKDALLDAQKVIELNPSSYLGYKLKNAALHGAEQYDEAIEAIETLLSKLGDTPDLQTQMLRKQYISPSEAHIIIRKVIDTEIENAPPHLINTLTGRLCDREAQINTFKATMEYKKLLSVTVTHANLRMEHIHKEVVMFFRYVMLSHRWEGKEPLLHDIKDRNVYKLPVDPIDGIAKLQSFCKVARDAEYRWAWSDTCCINKENNIELQQSVNTMFVWYRHSALTIVYLSDVLPSSKSGALAMSVWNSRGWTVQEFLAPKLVLFYQKDWTLYLNDRSPNHKESTVIMRELEGVTGINGRALVAFDPGMEGVREKLRWSSMRVTTIQEDIAYSLFGIFGVHLAPIYGENRENALGRLLREIIARSGDISCLDWVGKRSQFNSCFPASIISYGAPPSVPSAQLSDDEMQTSVFSLRGVVDVELALKLYKKLSSLSIPQFVSRRLHLPCIAFGVTSVRRKRGEDQPHCTFGVKVAGLRDLSITTEDKLIQFSRARPVGQVVLLVRPWDRSFLELPDFADPHDLYDTESEEDLPSPVGSLGENRPVDSECYSRALQSIVRLGRPFGALLLVQQQGQEYKRIASDQNIIAQVKDIASIRHMMDIRTLEIV